MSSKVVVSIWFICFILPFIIPKSDGVEAQHAAEFLPITEGYIWVHYTRKVDFAASPVHLKI